MEGIGRGFNVAEGIVSDFCYFNFAAIIIYRALKV